MRLYMEIHGFHQSCWNTAFIKAVGTWFSSKLSKHLTFRGLGQSCNQGQGRGWFSRLERREVLAKHRLQLRVQLRWAAQWKVQWKVHAQWHTLQAVATMSDMQHSIPLCARVA